MLLSLRVISLLLLRTLELQLHRRAALLRNTCTPHSPHYLNGLPLTMTAPGTCGGSTHNLLPRLQVHEDLLLLLRRRLSVLHLQNLAGFGHHSGRLFEGGADGRLLRKLDERARSRRPSLLQNHCLGRRELDRRRHHRRHLLLLLQCRLLRRHVHRQCHWIRQPRDLQHHVVTRRR